MLNHRTEKFLVVLLWLAILGLLKWSLPEQEIDNTIRIQYVFSTTFLTSIVRHVYVKVSRRYITKKVFCYFSFPCAIFFYFLICMVNRCGSKVIPSLSMNVDNTIWSANCRGVPTYSCSEVISQRVSPNCRDISTSCVDRKIVFCSSCARRLSNCSSSTLLG